MPIDEKRSRRFRKSQSVDAYSTFTSAGGESPLRERLSLDYANSADSE